MLSTPWTIPQEYSTCGVGDFRLPSIELELPCGSRSADLRYAGCQLRRGEPRMLSTPWTPERSGARSGERSIRWQPLKGSGPGDAGPPPGGRRRPGPGGAVLRRL